VKSYAKDFALILDHAKQGDATAKSMLGYCYLKGLGVRKDPAQARGWFLKAAKQGVVEAMYNLALMLEIGEGIPADRRQAMRWYRMGARAGDVKAQMNLGLMYIGGIRLNRVLGVGLLRKAARKGHPKAIYNLGVAYWRGDGVKESRKIAERYIRKAAQLGEKAAIAYLAKL
jgi:TPR repeat protein